MPDRIGENERRETEILCRKPHFDRVPSNPQVSSVGSSAVPVQNNHQHIAHASARCVFRASISKAFTFVHTTQHVTCFSHSSPKTSVSTTFRSVTRPECHRSFSGSTAPVQHLFFNAVRWGGQSELRDIIANPAVATASFASLVKSGQFSRSDKARYTASYTDTRKLDAIAYARGKKRGRRIYDGLRPHQFREQHGKPALRNNSRSCGIHESVTEFEKIQIGCEEIVKPVSEIDGELKRLCRVLLGQQRGQADIRVNDQFHGIHGQTIRRCSSNRVRERFAREVQPPVFGRVQQLRVG